MRRASSRQSLFPLLRTRVVCVNPHLLDALRVCLSSACHHLFVTMLFLLCALHPSPHAGWWRARRAACTWWRTTLRTASRQLQPCSKSGCACTGPMARAAVLLCALGHTAHHAIIRQTCPMGSAAAAAVPLCGWSQVQRMVCCCPPLPHSHIAVPGLPDLTCPALPMPPQARPGGQGAHQGAAPGDALRKEGQGQVEGGG